MANGNPYTSAQSPMAMQMIAPDLAIQQQQLTRQQAMADMLRKQALESTSPTEMVGGWAIKKSPLEGVSKLAQALLGNTMQGQVDSRQAELGKALQEKTGSFFDNLFGGEPAAASNTDTGQMQGIGAPMQNDQNAQIKRAAKAALLMGNQELANSLIRNVLEKTSEQKNMLAMGQDPSLMGQLGIAEARKKGIIELQPGTTALDLATGYERFQPKVGEGITLNNGAASMVPGYAQVNAAIEGAKAGATASAQAGQDLIDVNTPNGLVKMTRAQAVQLANGGGAGQQNQGVQFQNPNGASLNMQGSAQQVFDQLSKLPEPNRTEALQSFKQWMQQGNQKQVGIPLQSEAEKAAAIEAAKNQVARDFEKPQAKLAATTAISQIDNALKQIDYLGNSNGLSNITGSIAGRTPNISGKAIDAQAALDTLKNQIGVQVLDAMRSASSHGGAVGQVTEKEWPILQSQYGSLQQAQTTETFKRGLTDVKKTLERVKNSYGQAFADKYPQEQTTQKPAMTKINSDAEYNALPSGAEFIAPDGSLRRKP